MPLRRDIRSLRFSPIWLVFIPLSVKIRKVSWLYRLLAVVIHKRGFKLTPLELTHIGQIVLQKCLFVTSIVYAFLRYGLIGQISIALSIFLMLHSMLSIILIIWP